VTTNVTAAKTATKTATVTANDTEISADEQVEDIVLPPKASLKNPETVYDWNFQHPTTDKEVRQKAKRGDLLLHSITGELLVLGSTHLGTKFGTQGTYLRGKWCKNAEEMVRCLPPHHFRLATQEEVDAAYKKGVAPTTGTQPVEPRYPSRNRRQLCVRFSLLLSFIVLFCNRDHRLLKVPILYPDPQGEGRACEPQALTGRASTDTI